MPYDEQMFIILLSEICLSNRMTKNVKCLSRNHKLDSKEISTPNADV